MAQATRLTFRETLRRLAEDRRVLRACYTARGVEADSVWWTPSHVCVALYRLTRYCYVRGWRLPSRFFWQLNLLLTGADIAPLSDLGEGLLIVHPVAVVISGSAGRGLVVEGFGGMGGGLEMHDVGAGPGLPLLGNDVELAHGAMVLGPVTIGNGVRVGPGCTVTRDIPEHSEVLEQPVRIRRAAAEGIHDAA
jgi:serine O-acetyltransferase